MTRMVWDVVESVRQPEDTPGKLQDRRLVVLGGDPATAADVCGALSLRGAIVLPIGGGLSADAVAAAALGSGRIDGVVDLNVGRAFSMEDGKAWEAPLLQTMRLLQTVYDAWLEEENAERLCYVAVTRMGGHMGYRQAPCPQPLGGLWAGLAKTLPQELPNCHVKIVDLSESDRSNAGTILCRELYDWGHFEIGWIDGVRHGLRARAESPAMDQPDVSEQDVILLSGGARGIGLELAIDLADSCGCRVIVTGRHAVPDAKAPWAGLDDEQFRQYEWEELKRAGQIGRIAAARRQLKSARQSRELARTLEIVARRRLRIEYRQCDVTDEQAVRTLVRSLTPSPTVVVHNAGVDLPVRLPSKSVDAVLQTVRTKVDGFVNLVRAVEGIPIRLFCSVGSLTGRWGGMTGETDYAAANECLARMGMWLSGHAPFSVKTICWPTWDGVGMITNAKVTNAYMSPLDVDEGVAHWRRELRSSGSGEVTYVGNFGPALTPVQLEGFPGTPELPNIDALQSQLHYLGSVRRFRPNDRLLSACRIDADVAPVLDDFRVHGAAAVPVGVLLEYVLAGAAWIQPPGMVQLHLHEIRRVRCRLDRLRLREGSIAFTRDVRGAGDGREWVNRVSLTADDGVILSAEAVYRPPSPAAEDIATIPATEAARLELSSRLLWRGHVFDTGCWSATPEDIWMGDVRPCHPTDLWATLATPHTQLPLSHLESAIRGAAYLGARDNDCDGAFIASIRVRRSGEARYVTGNRSGTWHVLDGDRRVLLDIEGLEFGPSARRVP